MSIEPTRVGNQPPCVQMMIYGLPGAGKTRLIGSGEGLIIHPPTDHTSSIELPASVDEIEVSDWSQMLHVYQQLQQGNWTYPWVWLDSITLFQEFGMDDVFQAAIDRNPHRAEFGWDKPEYGINHTRLGKWMRDMVGLSKAGMFNFGVTAHVMEFTDPVADEDVWAPLVQGGDGKMSMKVMGYMNIVAYLQEVKDDDGGSGQRLLLTDAKGFIGKDQTNTFPKLKSGRHGFVNPTMEDVEAALAKRATTGSTTKRRKRPAKRRATKKS